MMRKRKWLVVVVAVVMVLGLMIGVVGARGPANRATGSVWISHPDYADAFVSFDAHAESSDGRRAAKGTVYWYSDVDGLTEEDIETLTPTFIADVNFVNVEGDTAWFAAERRGGGRWLFVKVVDGGSPGAGNDIIPLNNLPASDSSTAQSWVEDQEEPTAHNWTIVGGNLKVHYYE